MDPCIKDPSDFHASDSEDHIDPLFNAHVTENPVSKKGGYPYRPMSISEIMTVASGDTDKKEEIFLARQFIMDQITGSSDPTMIRMKNRRKNKADLF